MAVSDNWVCQNCGSTYRKWSGRCESCNSWNSIVAEVVANVTNINKATKKSAKQFTFSSLSSQDTPPARMSSAISEFDRVTGGGLVAGSALLVGGDPGIGKSTILLQIVASLANHGYRCAYISGEEAVSQISLRAERLGLINSPVLLAAATDLGDILTTLETSKPFDVVVIDSIQTLYSRAIEAAPGTVSQVRAAAGELVRFAKQKGVTIILVGHVTKDGQIAGPRVVEHLVDTVLYFEGERGHQCRILRAVKNRFGATDEIGVFEMTAKGLMPVGSASSFFIDKRLEDVSGTVVFAGIEGTRPLLVEIQALIAPSTLGTPRRSVVGWDSGRLAMVIAVLETRCGVTLGMRDIYLNIAGGLKISEPGADLAVAMALVSAAYDLPIASNTVAFGEIGLTGEIRPVSQTDNRLKEAIKLNFVNAYIPQCTIPGIIGLNLNMFAQLRDVVNKLIGQKALRNI